MLAIAIVLLAALTPAVARGDLTSVAPFPGSGRFLVAWGTWGATMSAGTPEVGFSPAVPLGAGPPSAIVPVGDRLLLLIPDLGSIVSDDKYPAYGATGLSAVIVGSDGRIQERRRITRGRQNGIFGEGATVLNDGSVVIAWDDDGRSRAIRRAANGAWGRVRGLGPPGFAVSGVAEDGRGLVAVGQRGLRPVIVRGRRVLRLRDRAAPMPHFPVIAADPRGGAFVVWSVGARLRVSRLSRSGRLGATALLAAVGEDAPGLGVPPDGRAVVSWGVPGRGARLAMVDRQVRSVRVRKVPSQRFALGPGERLAFLDEQFLAGRVTRSLAFGTIDGPNSAAVTVRS